MSAASRLAILYETDAYSFKNKVMGRQSAGIAFLKALAETRPERLWCYSRTRDSAVELANELRRLGSGATGIHWVSYQSPALLAEPGVLYRPDPVIAGEAWRRLGRADPRAYSLCGITHTTASHGVMETLAGLLTAPLEEWDAVICTSRAVRDTVRQVVEAEAEHLRERVGAARFTLPQLPVIPLGVHCADFADNGPLREAARAELGIAPDAVVVLFVGRLAFHGKAHPLPMYLGLADVATERPVILLQAGWFANEGIEKAFRDDAAALCPAATHLFVDGRDQAKLKGAWAAADIFTSMSDNIQETFGLTPIEAMAAGLPSVVTDWDGYRDTVRDGIDGFRVPTLALPPGAGADFADGHDLGLLNYDHYCGITSQFVAVDVEAAATAYRRLVADPDLRRRMGDAARARARAEFDWRVIFGRYQALWDDLSERRRSDAALHPTPTRRVRPARMDPYRAFASYPTRPIGPATQVMRRPGATAADGAARRGLATTSFAAPHLPAPELIGQVLDALPDGTWSDVGAVRAACPRTAPATLDRALVWLVKAGILTFRTGP